ncbi:MAG: glycogen debranching enzyme N-terminal domain-containing protein, partial [Thermoplasmata archaeon]|nr:glycogen debranching enzyme N-terminal domain-containing protein [Thermoplasmata archaeon]
MHQEPLKYTEKYSIDKEVCRVVDEITSRLISGIQPTNYREFIDTNGIGGYVSLTLLNELTRKFHGLLVASIKPPTNRWVFVSNLEEVIHLDDRDYRLSENIEIFKQHLFPEHVYRVEDITINRKIFMPYGENTTILRYEIKSDREFSLSFTPLINSRHFYDTKENLSFSIAKEGQEIRYKPNNNES